MVFLGSLPKISGEKTQESLSVDTLVWTVVLSFPGVQLKAEMTLTWCSCRRRSPAGTARCHCSASWSLCAAASDPVTSSHRHSPQPRVAARPLGAATYWAPVPRPFGLRCQPSWSLVQCSTDHHDPRSLEMWIALCDVLTGWTPRKHAFLPCGHLDFESAVTAQNDEFKCSFRSSYSRLLNVKNVAGKLNT